MAVPDAARKPLQTINPSPNALNNLVALSKAWADARIPTKPKGSPLSSYSFRIEQELKSK